MPHPDRSRRAFTLLEILTVILIIGVLAAIAIPQYLRQRDKAFVTTMKSDLRNLATAQESFRADSARYAASKSDVSKNWRESSGVTVTINEATIQGWSATAKHTATSKTCAIFVGTGVTPSGGSEGEPVCP